MEHIFNPQITGRKLSLPFFQTNEDYNPPVKSIIVGSDFELSEGDVIGYMVTNAQEETIFNPYCTIGKIIERRKARGDWSRCDFPQPDFIKFEKA